MTVSFLVSTYNWPDALELVLESLNLQSEMPDEILIADDGSKEETLALIDKLRAVSSVPIRHIWHEDEGFRRTVILNKAIAQSTCDYIIQTDGDCLLHRDFIRDHKAAARTGVYLYGSRVNILEGFVPKLFQKKQLEFGYFSEGIKNRTRNLRIPFLMKTYRPKQELSHKLRGCNLSFWKSDFIAVNGYNEAMTGWGREDSELVARLLNKGILGKRIRYGGIVYHIWHPTASKHNFNKNDAIQQETVETGRSWCEKGIDQYL